MGHSAEGWEFAWNLKILVIVPILDSALSAYSRLIGDFCDETLSVY